MTTAELIKTLADLGHGEFLATAKHPKALGLLCVYAATVGHKPTASSVTNGTTTVCVTTRPNGADFFLVESGDNEDNGNDLAETLARAGVKPAGNTTPTLEDVDAELQPKGLQALTLTEPVWFSEWLPQWQGFFVRKLLVPSSLRPTSVFEASVHKSKIDGTWGFQCERIAGETIKGEGHPTPEAAQAACEAAIIAAWRNR